MYSEMTLFMLGLMWQAALSDSSSSVIPSKEEQTNLIKNVEEVFNEVRAMVRDEGGATDTAVVGDVQKMVDRALQHLSLIEELALTKISCSASENSAWKADAKTNILGLIEEGQHHLQECIQEASDSIHNNSHSVTTTTGRAMHQGQDLLDTLNRCSRKSGLNVITCYKKVIATDVLPLKVMLLDAIQVHKSGHMQGIVIRHKANECVDYTLTSCRSKVSQILNEAPVS